MRLTHNTVVSAVVSIMLAGCSSGTPENSCQSPGHGNITAFHSHSSIMYSGPSNDLGYTNVYTRYDNLDKLYLKPSFYIVDGSMLQNIEMHEGKSSQLFSDRAFDDWLFFQMGLHHTDCNKGDGPCLTSDQEYEYHKLNGSHVLDYDQGKFRDAYDKNEISGQSIKSDNFVQFTFDRHDLDQSASYKVAELAAYLKRYPARKLVVNGSADASGSEKYNKNLSRNRAESVVKKLNDLGIPNDQIIVSWKGEYQSGYGPKFRIAEINYE